MKLVSKLSLSAALALATTLSLAVEGPALAQKKSKADKAAEASKYKPQLSPPFQKVIVQVQTAVAAKNIAETEARLAEATALATAPDEKFYVGAMRQNLGILKNSDKPTLKQALIEQINSGSPLAVNKGPFSKQLGIWAYDEKNYAEAASRLAAADGFGTKDSIVYLYLSDAYAKLRKPVESYAAAIKSIEADQKEGKAVDQERLITFRGNAAKLGVVSDTTDMSLRLATAYPNTSNIHDMAAFYINTARPADQARLDTFRFMRASKSISQGSEYRELVELLLKSRLPGEADAVLKEGIASGKLVASSQQVKDLDATTKGQLAGDRASLVASEKIARARADGSVASNVASALYGYGEYAKAIELFNVAIGKGGLDKDEAVLRIGMAQLAAGQKAEAAQTFSSVAGSRADLGKMWKFLASR